MSTQPFLASSTVVLLNAGPITSQVMTLLASAGVGLLRIVDTSVVTASDVEGSVLFPREDVGRARADALACRLRTQAPHVRCDAIQPTAYTAALVKPVLDGASLAMVCLERPDPVLLGAHPPATLSIDLPWIIAEMDGGVGSVGPTILPHQSPCYQCLELRRLANRTDSPSSPGAADGTGADHTDTLATPVLHACVAALAALDGIRMLTRMAVPQTVGRILRLGFFGAEITAHRVLRFPHCPACGYGDTRPLIERWHHPREEGAR